MTKLFEEYEFIRKSKENPETLVGESFYWNKNFLGETIPYELGNAFTIISYDKTRRLFTYKYLNSNLTPNRFVEQMIGKMALYTPEEEL